jgi:hypothetical protein
VRLTEQGLKIRDVGAALKLNPHEVAQILARASLRCIPNRKENSQ